MAKKDCNLNEDDIRDLYSYYEEHRISASDLAELVLAGLVINGRCIQADVTGNRLGVRFNNYGLYIGHEKRLPMTEEETKIAYDWYMSDKKKTVDMVAYDVCQGISIGGKSLRMEVTKNQVGGMFRKLGYPSKQVNDRLAKDWVRDNALFVHDIYMNKVTSMADVSTYLRSGFQFEGKHMVIYITADVIGYMFKDKGLEVKARGANAQSYSIEAIAVPRQRYLSWRIAREAIVMRWREYGVSVKIARKLLKDELIRDELGRPIDPKGEVLPLDTKIYYTEVMQQQRSKESEEL